MAQLRPEEMWAAGVIEACLRDVRVQQHDDGSEPGMYDFNLLRGSGQYAACEVTAAADEECIELWNVANGGDERWIEPGLDGGWMVVVSPRCRIKRLRKELPRILREAEVGEPSRVEAFRQALASLNVVSASKGETDYPGAIYLTVQQRDEGFSTMWESPSGDALPDWVGSWLASPEHAHNRDKLARSDAQERHMFVVLPGFTTAPEAVMHLLMRDQAPLPDGQPHLPPEVTHVWVTSIWNAGDVFFWGPQTGWARFAKPKQVAWSP